MVESYASPQKDQSKNITINSANSSSIKMMTSFLNFEKSATLLSPLGAINADASDLNEKMKPPTPTQLRF